MVKVDVISGFLGAGKTTLIKRLLASAFKGEQVVLIENEFGEIGVDGSFLKEAGIEIKEINSGCICCSLVGDFEKSVEEIVSKFNPDRIIIEPSGVGKLSDIVKAIEKVKADLQLNIIATVADGGKVGMYIKNFGEFYIDQVKQANTIVISKTDKITEDKLQKAIASVRAINANATLITTNLESLDSETLLSALQSDVHKVDSLIAELKEAQHHHHHEHSHHHDEECCCHGHHHHEHDHKHDHHHEHDEECHCHGHHHEHHHHADEVFTSWGEETVVSYTKSALDKILQCLASDERILRAKGIVKALDSSNWYYFDLVMDDYEIREGQPDVCGRICVIGARISEEELKNFFKKA